MEKKLRIVYMGTPDFAVAPLRRLVEENYHIVGVVTMPDKPVGRHQNELQASPVKQYITSVQTLKPIPLLQPEKLKDELFLQQLRDLHADLQIVVAFRMLPEVVWSMPRLGTFNLHASLLPQYRGAAPINWAIINGDKETGNTTFFLQQEIDTGNIIEQRHIPIGDDDTAGTMHDKLMALGADMVIDTVQMIENGIVNAIPQQHLAVDELLRPAPKIFKETCKINWNGTVQQVYDFIRGLSPYPAAYTTFVTSDGERLVVKIFETRKELCNHTEPVGTVDTDGKRMLKIALCDGYLHLLSLQVAGKRRMSINDFLCGFRLPEMLKIE